jgi:hypothetical protein
MLTGTKAKTLGYTVDRARKVARQYAERNMQATVVISRMEMHPEPFDDTGLYPTETTQLLRVLYTGPARIYNLSDSQLDYAGEEQVFSTTYISTPMDVDGVPLVSQANDMIEVTEHPDPLVQGRWFRVVTVDSGGQFPILRRHQVTGAARFAEWTYVEEP